MLTISVTRGADRGFGGEIAEVSNKEAATPSILGAQNEKRRIASWQNSIDELQRWLRDSSCVVDDGIDVPSDAILRLSLDVAESFRDKGLPPPTSIVVDPNGGVVLERKEGRTTEVVHVWDDGFVEYMQFDDSALVERRELW